MRLPPAPKEIDNDAIISEPRIAARAAAATPQSPGGGRRIGFDTSDWRNWSLFATAIAVFAGAAAAGLGSIGRTPIDIDGLRPMTTHDGLTVAGGAALAGLLMLVVLPACVMGVIGHLSKGAMATATRTAIAACALLLGCGYLAGGVLTALRPQPTYAEIRPAISMDDVLKKSWEKERANPTTPEQRRDTAARKLVEHLVKLSAPIAEKAAEFNDLGGMTPSTFTDNKTLESRIQLLRHAQRSGAEVVQQVRGLPRTIQSIAAGVAANAVEETAIAKELTDEALIQRLVRVREIDCELYESFEAFLMGINSNRSKWTVKEGQLQFTDAGFAQKMAVIASRVKRLTNEQAGLQKEIMTAAAGGAEAQTQ
ncbi:MAG: hypothetical protein QM783_19845 [Phycisphaerales bacterium]